MYFLFVSLIFLAADLFCLFISAKLSKLLSTALSAAVRRLSESAAQHARSAVVRCVPVSTGLHAVQGLRQTSQTQSKCKW